MNIAVVDDSRIDSDSLVQLLCQYEKHFAFDMTVSCFLSGEAFIASFPESNYDVVFLDIFMEPMDGIETARQLWAVDPQCLVVFLTVSQEHIWQAAGLHCFDYIDKAALTKERIFRVIADLRRRLPQIQQALRFTSGSQSVSLPVCRIQYILSDNNYTIFKMADETEFRYRISFRSICELAEQAPCFLNCNRGILLNMDFILREEADIYVMLNGQRFPIRRFERSAVKNTYHHYQFQKLDRM